MITYIEMVLLFAGFKDSIELLIEVLEDLIELRAILNELEHFLVYLAYIVGFHYTLEKADVAVELFY